MTPMNDREMEWVVSSGTKIWLLVILMLFVMMSYLYSLDGPSRALIQ